MSWWRVVDRATGLEVTRVMCDDVSATYPRTFDGRPVCNLHFFELSRHNGCTDCGSIEGVLVSVIDRTQAMSSKGVCSQCLPKYPEARGA